MTDQSKELNDPEPGENPDSAAQKLDSLTPQEIALLRKLLALYQQDLERRANDPELQADLQERFRHRLTQQRGVPRRQDDPPAI